MAFEDGVLIDWLMELIEDNSPQFLSCLAEAAIVASPEEYAILRPGLLLLKRRQSTPPAAISKNPHRLPNSIRRIADHQFHREHNP